jgi:probable F420-dependent oxidoreductase
MDLGTIGIWAPKRFGAGAVREIEALGYGTLWLGSSPSVEEARPYLEASSSLVIATGILNVWQHEPADVAAATAEVRGAFGDRFLLGIGIGHPEATSDYRRPLTAMRRFFDGLDDGAEPVPREARIAAALGPKMLQLAAERSLGTHPYFVPVQHTALAREAVGSEAVVAPEVAVVVEPDADRARAIAREYASLYLNLSNYTNNLRNLGYTERDLADGGSDKLIDEVIPHGTPDAIAEAVQAHLDAGADHVCLQPLGSSQSPLDDYRALAAALL